MMMYKKYEKCFLFLKFKGLIKQVLGGKVIYGEEFIFNCGELEFKMRIIQFSDYVNSFGVGRRKEKIQ